MASIRVDRRRALGSALAAALLASLGARSQSIAKPRRIGVLLVTSRKRANIERLLVPFDQALRELGQVFLTVATYLHRKRIAEFAAAQRIPAIYGYVE